MDTDTAQHQLDLMHEYIQDILERVTALENAQTVAETIESD